MDVPLVSVVVPTYDRAYCVTHAIDSALAQTHPRMEVVVVDDGSTDETQSVLARAYGGDARVRVMVQDNQGVSVARNAGLAAARGDFVALLDSDDVWAPWKIEAQLACLSALPAAGMVWTDMDAVAPDGEITVRNYLTTMYSAYRFFPSREALFSRSLPLAEVAPAVAARIGSPRLYGGDLFSPMLLGNLVHTSTVLLTRERLERVGGFDLALGRAGEDHDFHLRTCREGEVAYLDVASIRYLRGRADQLTYGTDNQLLVARNYFRTVLPVLERDRHRIRLDPALLDAALADGHLWVAELHAERGERGEALRHLALSLRHRAEPARLGRTFASLVLPRTLRAWIRGARRRLRG